VYHKAIIVKILNLTVSILAVFIFLTRAPFSRLQKILFIGGLFPLYIYPVINRDYSLSMLLTFVFCVLYERRFSHFVLLGSVLFLLANTHIHSWITVAAILGSLCLEFVLSADSRRQWRSRPVDTCVGFGLILAGLVCSYVSVTPDSIWNVVRPVVTLPLAVKGAALAVLAPERAFPTLFGFDSSLFLKLSAWALAIYLWRNFYLFMIYAGAVLGLGLFFHVMFLTTALRHQAAFYLLLIIVLWIDKTAPERPLFVLPLKFFQDIRNFVGRYKEPAFTLILVLQVCAAYPAIKDDVRKDYSPSRRLAQFLKHDPVLKNAIVIPEPDTFAEALPYYADNPIFIAREGRFGPITHYTIESRSWYTLSELLSDSKKVKASTGKPVVILLGHHVSPQGPFKIDFSVGTRKTFTYTPESLKDFLGQTKKVAGFHQTLTDEEYDVYLLK